MSGVPALLLRGRPGEVSNTFVVLLGSAAGLTSAVSTLVSGTRVSDGVRWQLPNAFLAVHLDPLAAAFLLPVFVLGAAASVYGLGYWPAKNHPSAGRVRVFTGLLLAGMATVVVAAHAVLFLLAWEVMAIAAFFLIATEDTHLEVRGAAWMYLIATHVGTMALLALFVVLRNERGTFLLGPVSTAAGPFVTSAILLLALAGFGFKAGIVPLHFWLPGAHANAPSHVSALLSGAMLKVGIYGIIRTLFFLPHPPVWWGGLLVAAGLTSGLVAIALAIGQSDMKRALAYSSIENVGIIVTALGLFVIGRALALPALAALCLGAAIAHVWNHSLFKSLLFLCAGNVLHATGTRRMDRMGGLLQKMPGTGVVFVIGAASAAALPGTNAFVSEALLYLGFLREATRGGIAAVGAAVLALIGALAVTCFVRLTGAMFLGTARTDEAGAAHEAPLLMRAPLVVLAIACIALGVFPTVIGAGMTNIVSRESALIRPSGTFSPRDAGRRATNRASRESQALLPFSPAREEGGHLSGNPAGFLHSLTTPLQLLALVTALALAALIAMTRKSPRQPTWDCGYALPTARMQYTARSLSEWLTARLLPRFLTPAIRATEISALYPPNARFSVDVDEPFADRVLLPVASRWALRAMRLRWLQQGRLPLYLLYIFVTLIAGVVWVVVFPLVGGVR